MGASALAEMVYITHDFPGGDPDGEGEGVGLGTLVKALGHFCLGVSHRGHCAR